MKKPTPFRYSLITVALASMAGFALAESYPGDDRTTTAPITSPPSADLAAMTPTAPTAPAPGSQGFVSDIQGNPVRSVTGNCVESVVGGNPYDNPACGGVIVTQVAPPVAQVPEEQPPMAQPPREIPMRRVTLDADTTFNFDSAELTDEGQEQLRNIVEVGQEEGLEGKRIRITGFADRIGPDDYNQQLSEERATAVRDYLVEAGLPEDVITVEGRGESNPVVQCEGMSGVSLIECLRPNRRSEVEFAALEPAEPAAEESMENVPSSEPWAPGTDTGTPR